MRERRFNFLPTGTYGGAVLTTNANGLHLDQLDGGDSYVLFNAGPSGAITHSEKGYDREFINDLKENGVKVGGKTIPPGEKVRFEVNRGKSVMLIANGNAGITLNGKVSEQFDEAKREPKV